MKLLLIGGSSFIGKNLIEKAPADWEIEASYCNSNNFLKFASDFPNVKPFFLNLMEEEQIPEFQDIDVIVYLAGIGPGQTTGNKEIDKKIMYRLHTEGASMVAERVNSFNRLIYMSSGVFYLENDRSVYRKSRLLGEADIQAAALKKKFSYFIIRNMEIYGPYMATHKIYRRFCEACFLKKKKFQINGNGNNLIDTMYIDDYIKILLKIIDSNISNEIIPVCKSQPVTIKELAKTVAEIYSFPEFTLSFDGKPTEDTRFVLDNRKMIDLFGIKPETSLRDGLIKWKNKGLA